MENRTLEQIRSSLVMKRENLVRWLHTSSPDKREVRLGPADPAMVEEHLQVLDEAARDATDGTLGICTVCHEPVDTPLLEMDYTACVCLDHFSDQQRQQLESELELAASVQRSLLPQAIPDTPYLQIAAYSRPAQIIGGDYFGFFEFANAAQGLVIADVAGHGVAASLHMAGVHALLQALTATSTSPAAVLEHVQRLFVHNASFSTFVTVFLCSYDPGNRTLTYSNAGQNPPLLLTCEEDGRRIMRTLRPNAPAIGLVENIEFPVSMVKVLPGDALLLYTDGVVEALGPNGEDYGDSRLAEIFERLADAPAGEILRGIREDLERFVDGQPLADDATLVVCKILE